MLCFIYFEIEFKYSLEANVPQIAIKGRKIEVMILKHNSGLLAGLSQKKKKKSKDTKNKIKETKRRAKRLVKLDIDRINPVIH